MDWEKTSEELRRKLDPASVKPAKQYGPKGDYIEGWHAIAEANRIFGFGGWSYTITECTCVSSAVREIGAAKKPGWGITYTAKVMIDVSGVIREDFGAGHGYDVDCGLAHESAIKEAVTDALKRALRSFGSPFGLALYDKSRENVGVDLPPYNAKAVVERLTNAIAKRKTKQALRALWADEADTLAALYAADKIEHGKLVALFTATGRSLPNDKAMQAPGEDE